MEEEHQNLSPDVLIVGGGVAGLLAAYAARAQGCDVTILQKAKGTTAMSSGAVDVATMSNVVNSEEGYYPLRHPDVYSEAAERVALQSPRHPYAQVGREGREHLAQALNMFSEMAHGLNMTARDDGRNMVLMTQMGTLKSAAMCQARCALDFSQLPSDSHIALLDLDDLGGYDAASAQKMLQWIFSKSRHSHRVSIVRVPTVFNGGTGPAESAGVLARRIVAAQKTSELIASITTEIGHIDEKPTHLLAPPVLGQADGESSFQPLFIHDLPVFEMLSLPPSDLGRRLMNSLEVTAAKQGIQIIHAAATSGRIGRSGVEAVTIKQNGKDLELRPKTAVLCSGRFLSGGLKRDGGTIEQIFRLPVETGGEWLEDAYVANYLGDTPTDDHPLFRSGIAFDRSLRPMVKGRQIAAPNLFAAGSILSGYDPAKDGTGMGVSILTGYLAGQEAAQLARVGERS